MAHNPTVVFSDTQASEEDSLLRSSSTEENHVSGSRSSSSGRICAPEPGEKTSSSSLPSVSERLLQRLSSSQRVHALKNLGVGPAARLIRDAVLGEKSPPEWYDPYAHTNEPIRNFIAILCGRLVSSRWMNRLIKMTAWILVLLSFVEPPTWCRYGVDSIRSKMDSIPAVDLDAYGSCAQLLHAQGRAADGTENVPLYPNSSSMWLSLDESYYIEGCCLIILVLFMVLQLGKDGMSLWRFFQAGSWQGIRTLRIFLVVCLTVGLLKGQTKYSPFFRLPLLGTYLKSYQKEFISFIEMLAPSGTILSVLAILILFYGWFGVVIFYDSEQGTRDFSNLIEGCWTMWICVTTANYPDVMMPSYNNNRLSGLFFVSYMVISFFLIMNLILAAVVNAYDASIDKRKESRKKIALDSLTKAFSLMDGGNTGYVERESIMALFCILNEDFPEIRRLSEDETKLLFGFLDRDGSARITMDEFQNFGNILLLEFTAEADYYPFVQQYLPRLFSSEWYQRFCSIVRSARFDNTVDLLLVANAIVIAIQSYPELIGESVNLNPQFSNGHVDTWEEIVETVFTAVYALEALSKIMVNGWKRYSESARNLFDFTITVIAMTATIYVYYPNAYSDSRLVRLVVMARVLRLIRLLMIAPQFQLLGTITAEILPAAVGVLLLLFFLMYYFSALGMILYGGLITRDPQNPLSQEILDTDFSDNDYWANNFNDMVGGMNVLFNLLVVNNWTNCEIGYEAVAGLWVRLFFLSFHILGVVLVNNLVIALIIQGFFEQWRIIELRNNEDIVPGEAIIKGELARFEADTITGTSTGATGGYYARLRNIYADVEIDEREGLRRLFTQQSSDIPENDKDAT